MVNHDQNNSGDKVRSPNTLLREEVMQLGGHEIVTRTEAYVRKEDGSIVRQSKTNCTMAADGRWLKVDEFGGTSYTGQAVPNDRLAYCLNPFEDHEQRLVYVGVDGVITERGNVLCAGCLEHQKKRLFWKAVLVFGLIYQPEEF
jgi:hypothetical protein